MHDSTNQHPVPVWNKARREMTVVLRRHASRRQMVCYSDMLRQITTIRFALDDVAYHRMLGEVSEAEDEAGRGMLSCIVVHKVGDQQPGTGYYELAERLDRDTSDRLKCWVDEVKFVFDIWANKKLDVNTP